MSRRLPSLVLALAGLTLLVFGATHVYQNENTASLYGYGRGNFTVHSCVPAKQGYDCQGDFMQSGGMIEVRNVPLRTANSYPAGNTITDIYADYGSHEQDPIASDTRLQTGKERRSLRHNSPYLISVVVGLGMIIWVGTQLKSKLKPKAVHP